MKVDIQQQILLDMKKRHEDNAKPKPVRKPRQPKAPVVPEPAATKEAEE